ncbi:MAG TPA: pyridoxamine 5'-phosphate oxidase family protein [Methanomicrobiales archaeon]|nr:pyridoxamine 5'-phosphate oxidase family protein [Methanomicrobiales archaeon]
MALKENILKVIGGMHPAAIATIDQGKPAVRFMVLWGLDDMTLFGATMKTSRKVAQLRKNPVVSIAIWSGKEYTDPYVTIQAKGEVREDLPTKKQYWTPMMEQYFQKVDNPDFVVLVFTASEIEYIQPGMTGMETWKR